MLARAVPPSSPVAASTGTTDVGSAGAGPIDAAVAALFHAHFDFVWRSLRRLGVAPGSVDDAAQDVFLVAARKLDAIAPGKEKAFLFGVALRIAADARKRQRRGPALDELTEVVDPAQRPDEALDRARARARLDQILAELGDDVRPVFVLHELEGLPMSEIATMLELAPGTVASRLRRAREQVTAAIARTPRRSHG